MNNKSLLFFEFFLISLWLVTGMAAAAVIFWLLMAAKMLVFGVAYYQLKKKKLVLVATVADALSSILMGTVYLYVASWWILGFKVLTLAAVWLLLIDDNNDIFRKLKKKLNNVVFWQGKWQDQGTLKPVFCRS